MKTKASAYDRMGEELSIMEIKINGQLIILSDSSRWHIKTGDTTKTMSWYPTQRVLVEEGKNLNHPFKVRNLDSYDDVVEAGLE
jgi:hypothetical protein